MKSRVIVLGAALVACVALAGNAFAQVKGAGKSSISIIKVPLAGPTTPSPKAAGSVASKPSMSVVGKPPTGGGIIQMKLAKDLNDPAKPGFADGEYVLDIESSATSAGNLVGDPAAAAFFVTLTVSGQKCTIHSLDAINPLLLPTPTCGGPMQPLCGAPEGIGKCSASIYQVAGTLLESGGLVANQAFGARFRIRTNPDPANCKTGHLFIAGIFAPGTSTCRTGAVVGVGGVALGTTTPPTP